MAPPSSSTTEVSPRTLVDLQEVWFPWPPSGMTESLSDELSIVGADDLANIAEQATSCRIDPDGYLVLRKPNQPPQPGNHAGDLSSKGSLRGDMPRSRLPQRMYAALLQQGYWSTNDHNIFDITSPDSQAERDFLLLVYPKTKSDDTDATHLQRKLSVCRDGLFVFPLASEGIARGIAIVCDGEKDEKNVANTQECADPFDPTKAPSCIKFWESIRTGHPFLDACSIRPSSAPETVTVKRGNYEYAIVTGYKPAVNFRHLYESLLVVLLMDSTGEGEVALPIQRDGETDLFEGSALSWMTQVMGTPEYRALIDVYQKQFAGFSPTDPRRPEWLKGNVANILDPSLRPTFDAKIYSDPDELLQHTVLMALLYATILYEASGLFDLSKSPPDQLAWNEAVNTGNPGTLLADPAVQATISSLSTVSANLVQPFPSEVVVGAGEGSKKITRENILGALRASFSRIALSHYAGEMFVASDEKVSDGWPRWVWIVIAAAGTLAAGGAAFAALRPGEESRGGGNGLVPVPEPVPVPVPQPTKPATGTTSATGQGGGRGRP